MCMKSLTKITGQLLSSFMFLLVTRINRTMLEIAVIENLFPWQINGEISEWLMTALIVIYGTEFPSYITF